MTTSNVAPPGFLTCIQLLIPNKKKIFKKWDLFCDRVRSHLVKCEVNYMYTEDKARIRFCPPQITKNMQQELK
jgi:hypothetical protein